MSLKYAHLQEVVRVPVTVIPVGHWCIKESKSGLCLGVSLVLLDFRTCLPGCLRITNGLEATHSSKKSS